MNDLYAQLGVTKDATAEEITEAYRLSAKNLHPDRNPGDEDAARLFAWVSDAYEVLSDPARRAAYDRDGTTKRQADLHQQLLVVLVPVMMDAIQACANGFGADIRHSDLVAKMKDKITSTLHMIEEHHGKMKEGEKTLETVIGRFVTDDPANLLDQAVRAQLAGLRNSIAAVKEDLDRHQRALDYLKTVKYTKDGVAVGNPYSRMLWSTVTVDRAERDEPAALPEADTTKKKAKK